MTGNVALKVGDWNGKVDLMVYPLDDFELILGNEFFVAAKVAVVPHLCGILIADEKQPCFVPRQVKEKRDREGTGGWLSAILVQELPDLASNGRKQAQRVPTVIQWQIDKGLNNGLDQEADGQSKMQSGKTS